MLHARRWFAPFAAFALLASLASFAGGGMESVPFDSDRWEFVGSGGVVEYMGRKCLAGTATLKDAELHNGVIEEDGDPEQVFESPKSDRFRQFIMTSY